MIYFTKSLRLFVLTFLLAFPAFAQEGRIIREKLHSVALENTITKENPDRMVSIYLPPSYDKSPDRRYAVLYLLHGIGDTDETWTKPWNEKNDGYWAIQNAMNKGVAEGKFGEMIVVMPDNKTNWFGSFYVNSSVTGNWEDFNAKELVKYVDGKYRTIAKAENRGILGHSMGGYGAITLAMKHPEVFSVAYGMNPAVIDWGGDLTIASPSFAFVLSAKSYDDLLKSNNLYNIAIVTVAQAFSPNPNKPPFYADLPFKTVDGRLQPDETGFRKWRENSMIRMVEKYQANLKKLRGLRFDSGYEDEFKFIPVNSRLLSTELTNYGIEHVFEEYNGDHRNRMWGRRGRLFSEILPYFWEMLKN
jgi:S-formylglutathione hydrolase FrmB